MEKEGPLNGSSIIFLARCHQGVGFMACDFYLFGGF